MHGGFTRDAGHRLMRQAIEDGLEFSAVVAATDMVAAGALTALHEGGPTVPGGISLAGYDDIPFARDLHPALTTVHLPYEELGRLAVRTALERTPGAPDEHLLLGTHVVVRDSVGPPRSRRPGGPLGGVRLAGDAVVRLAGGAGAPLVSGVAGPRCGGVAERLSAVRRCGWVRRRPGPPWVRAPRA